MEKLFVVCHMLTPMNGKIDGPYMVDPKYLTYLRQFDISYIFAGKKDLDCALLLHKLKTMFGIEKLMVAGSGLWLAVYAERLTWVSGESLWANKSTKSAALQRHFLFLLEPIPSPSCSINISGRS